MIGAASLVVKARRIAPINFESSVLLDLTSAARFKCYPETAYASADLVGSVRGRLSVDQFFKGFDSTLNSFVGMD
jgi:hypothetical protein